MSSDQRLIEADINDGNTTLTTANDTLNVDNYAVSPFMNDKGVSL